MAIAATEEDRAILGERGQRRPIDRGMSARTPSMRRHRREGQVERHEKYRGSK
jgi:hypothetical protein